jgi:MFS transporter, PPP family, 3-phenylpropionic acid transporter
VTTVAQRECKAPSLFWVKLLYLAVYSSYGATSVYRTLYYRRVGLSGAEIGLLIALEPLVMLVAGPLWSLIADRLGLRARLLTAVTGLSILPMLATALTHDFAALAALCALYAFFTGPIQPLMDCIALTVLGQEQRHKYGSVRAWGSAGYAPVMWLIGVIIQGQDIRWIYVAYALLMGVACLLSVRMRVAQDVLAKNVGVGLGSLLRDRAWLTFIVAVFLAMMAQTVGFSYVGLYLDTLGASEGLIGFQGALGSVGQTFWMMTLLPWLLRRWGSERLMVLSFVAYAARFAVWALVPSTVAIVASQALMGLTFGTFIVASVDFADRHAPPGMGATSQALINGLVSGLGRSMGGVVAGPLYDGVGPQGTFGAFGLFCALAGAVFAGIYWPRVPGTRKPAWEAGRQEEPTH